MDGVERRARRAVKLESELRILDRKIVRRFTQRGPRDLDHEAATSVIRLTARRQQVATAHAELVAQLPIQALASARRFFYAPASLTHQPPGQSVTKLPAPRTRLARGDTVVDDWPAGGTDEGATSISRFLTADPDQQTRTVWVLPSSKTFHRRDCQVVEGRETARQVPVQRAVGSGMERCRHCCPSVR
jgi:hypothetical protein